jgi:hypothetical protein
MVLINLYFLKILKQHILEQLNKYIHNKELEYFIMELWQHT